MRVPASRFRDGVWAAAPIVPPDLAFGVSFGVLARAAGFDPFSAVVMSATTFAGSAQFATVSILGSGGGLVAAVAAALLLNGRYAQIGVSVGSIFPGRAARRVLESQLIVDESWALASRGRQGFDRRVLLGAGAALWVTWTTGTLIGALAGKSLGDPEALGLDGAFPALFLALLVPHTRGTRRVLSALAAAAVALALTPFSPPGVPIVAAALVCVVGLRSR